jgi:hypothetical protein
VTLTTLTAAKRQSMEVEIIYLLYNRYTMPIKKLTWMILQHLIYTPLIDFLNVLIVDKIK